MPENPLAPPLASCCQFEYYLQRAERRPRYQHQGSPNGRPFLLVYGQGLNLHRGAAHEPRASLDARQYLRLNEITVPVGLLDDRCLW